MLTGTKPVTCKDLEIIQFGIKTLSPVGMGEEVGGGISVNGLSLQDASAFQHKPLNLRTKGERIPFKPNIYTQHDLVDPLLCICRRLVITI